MSSQEEISVAAAADEDSSHRKISHAWRALRHRNFRLFVYGQSISLIGTWMTSVAIGWLVYRLTNSAFLLGAVGFSGQILAFLLSPFAGVWADRVDRRQVLVWTQIVAMVQALLLAWLTLSGHVTITWLLSLSIVQGVVIAFEFPARQSLLGHMVDDRHDLGNAIAINSVIVNLARLAGPSLGGLLIAATNEGWCFLIDGVSYLAVIASLLQMHLHLPASSAAATSALTELKEGWEYVSGVMPLRTILLHVALVCLVGMPFVVLLPVFSVNVLHGGPHTLGFLMGAMGLGALISALTLAARRNVLGLSKMIPIAAVAFGVGLIGLGMSTHFWLSMGMMMLAGYGAMQSIAASNTIIQTIAHVNKRGRVMSYFTMAFIGMPPFGSLLAGTLAHGLGAPRTVILNGAIVITGAVWFATQLSKVRSEIRPIYRRRGILPAEVIEDPAAD